MGTYAQDDHLVFHVELRVSNRGLFYGTTRLLVGLEGDFRRRRAPLRQWGGRARLSKS